MAKVKSSGDVYKSVEFDKIQTDPEQFENVRGDLGDLESLSKTIEDHGLINPLIVRKRGRGKSLVYDLVDGFRRHGAISLARKNNKDAFAKVPVRIVEDADEKKLLLVNLVSNFERKDYTQAEMSSGLHRLESMGLRRKDIAQAFSKTAAWVTQIMRFEENAIPELKELSRQGKITNTAAGRAGDLKKKKNQKEFVKVVKEAEKKSKSKSKSKKTGTRASSDRKGTAASKKKNSTKKSEEINKALTKLEADEGKAFFKLGLKKPQVSSLVESLTEKFYFGSDSEKEYALGALSAIAHLLGSPEMSEDISDIRDFLATMSIEVPIAEDNERQGFDGLPNSFLFDGIEDETEDCSLFLSTFEDDE